MRRRLALKLILSLMILVGVTEGISGLINVKSQERQLLDAMIEGADQLSKAITSSTWHAMLADHRDTAYEMMQTIALKQGINKIQIFNREGRVMFSTQPGETRQVDRRSETCALCHSSLQPLVKVDVPSRARIFKGPEGSRKLAMVTPIYNEPACSQAACHAHPEKMKVLGVLDVTLDLDRIDREVANIKVRGYLATGIHIFLVSLFIIFFTQHFVDAPIRKLIDATKAVSAMQLDKPIKVESSEELGELARSFDVMRERLKQSVAENEQFLQSLEAKVEERTEQLKAANQKLMQTDRLASLGQLSASVAHEINNPLSGVLNLSKLMQRILKDDGIPPNRIEEFRRFLSQIVNETTRVGRIVSDLLAFSRRSKPQSKRADLNAIVKTTLSLVSHKLSLGNVGVNLNLAENLPVVPCDSSQMQQVVMNLIMNAAEATYRKGQGSVTITTRVQAGGSKAVLEVVDNGEGIAPENMSKIFDPFFSTKEEGKSVGLGLAVVYGIVDSHGGDIEVKSKRGEGSMFRVVLPLSPEQEVAEAAPASTVEKGSRM
ncbi:MAG: HAMP domain-containing protein [Acidobacteriia bacterium]|nr:HAMP domain-containing protein [Terriglobia bacterium]